jgi:hypothetical protein
MILGVFSAIHGLVLNAEHANSRAESTYSSHNMRFLEIKLKKPWAILIAAF